MERGSRDRRRSVGISNPASIFSSRRKSADLYNLEVAKLLVYRPKIFLATPSVFRCGNPMPERRVPLQEPIDLCERGFLNPRRLLLASLWDIRSHEGKPSSKEKHCIASSLICGHKSHDSKLEHIISERSDYWLHLSSAGEGMVIRNRPSDFDECLDDA